MLAIKHDPGNMDLKYKGMMTQSTCPAARIFQYVHLYI